MATSNYPHCFLSLFVITTFLCPLSCYAQYFFIFGDSLYDPGNNRYYSTDFDPAYHPPYGTTFFNSATGRHSDGRVVADFIASYLNIPFIPPYMDSEADFSHGASFASAGAGVFNTTPKYMYLGGQVNQFENFTKKWVDRLGPDVAKSQLNSAVYLICIGGNDHFQFMTKKGSSCTLEEQEEYVTEVFEELKLQVEKIYNLGGRKFMFQTVAPIGCLPEWKQTYNLTGDACAGKPLRQAYLHNAALVNLLGEVKNNLTDFQYSVFDYNHAMGKRVDDPAKYGFRKGDMACCGAGSHRADNCGAQNVSFALCFDPNEYVWFDGGHNTDRVNQQLAELMWSGADDVVSPFTIKQLFELEPTANPTTAATYFSRKSLLRFWEKW